MPPRFTRMPFRFRNAVPAAIVDFDVAIVDQRQTFRDLAAVGDAIVLVLVVELPQAGQRGERDVEPAAGRLADLACHAQHLARVGADGNGMVAGCCVEADDIAALASRRSSSRRDDRTRRTPPQTPPRLASHQTSTRSGRPRFPSPHANVSTRWAAPVATGARLHAAVSAPDMKNAHAARTDGVTAGARQARGREADRLPCV